jgi:anti-anti-sigma factor
MEFEVTEREDDVTQIALIGSLNLDAVHSIEIKFNGYVGGQSRPAIVDLSQVDFVASLGMRMLLSNARNLDKAGAKMVLLNPQPVVESALTTAGITQVMPIVRSEEDALELFGLD